MNRKITAVAIAMMFAVPAFAQSAEDISALKAQLKMLQNRIEQLESTKPAAAAAPSAQAVTGGDIPNSFKLPGSNTSVSLGGYIKAIAVHSDRGPLGNPGHSDEWLIPTQIPLSNSAESTMRRNYWKESSKESRIVLQTNTPSEYGPINTILEFDFYGTAGTETATNSNMPRVRHAWGTIGNLGAGQFWSNMANMTAVPETVDFTPQVAIFGAVRQTGVRWTQPFSSGFWSVAVENPEARIVSNTAGTITGPDNDKNLNYNAKVHLKLGTGEYEVAGAMAKVNTSQVATAPAPGPVVLDKTGFGISFSGFVPTFGTDHLKFGVSTTRAMGRHTGLIGDVVQVGTELRGVDVTSYFFGYKHDWTPKLRSTLAHSDIRAQNPQGIATTGAIGARATDLVDKRLQTYHLNLIWAMTPQMDVGGEFIHARRQVESGLDGSLNRFMAMAKYKFQ